jgi:hypothetical protein
MRDMRNAYTILVGKPEVRSLGRRRRKWEDNIKIGPRIIMGVDWIHLAQDRYPVRVLLNTVMNEPLGPIKTGYVLTT